MPRPVEDPAVALSGRRAQPRRQPTGRCAMGEASFSAISTRRVSIAIKLGGSRTDHRLSRSAGRSLAGRHGREARFYRDVISRDHAEHEVAVHRAAVTALKFGGGRLASAGLDGEVKVWAANPEALGRPPLVLAHGGWVWALAFDSSGDRLFSAGADGRIRAWLVSGRVLADQICQRVGRKNLNREEWALYLSSVPYTSTCPDVTATGGRP